MNGMRFLEVISSSTLLGLSIASYFYFLFSFHVKLLQPFTLKLTLALDTSVLILLFILTLLTVHFSQHPGLLSGGYLFGAALCVVLNMICKIRNHRCERILFFLLGSLQILSLIMVVYDKVIL